ncbi:MAG: type II toxin-antitoxin system RelE/ParE family toxin [Mesorhizobium sp.]|nr:type II toxin-antitoxin system RelE/ParE family toxin [Mesorhizobium sp.]
MAWTIRLLEAAERDLRKLHRNEAKRVRDFLMERVAKLDNPRVIGDAPVGPLKGYWRYRVGDYRILCRIEDEKLVIVAVEIGHRSDIYR